VGQHRADAAAAPGCGQLVLANRNDEVRRLNADIRAGRQAAGELGPGIRVAGAEYSAGDRLVFLKNDNHGLQVANLARVDEPSCGGNWARGPTKRPAELALPPSRAPPVTRVLRRTGGALALVA
jgi:hypothetical protein